MTKRGGGAGRAASGAHAAPDRSPLDLTGTDWSKAGLGQPSDWDPALLTAVRMINASPMPMAILLGDKGWIVPNRATDELFRSQVKGSLVGQSVLDALPYAAPFYASVLRRGQAGNCTSVHGQPLKLVRNGSTSTAWFNLDYVPITDVDDKVLGLLGLASDVTQQVLQNRALAETTRGLKQALGASGMVGVWNLDVATRTTTCDAGAAAMFNLPASACEEGQPDEVFNRSVHADDRAMLIAAQEETIETGKPYRCRYRVLSNGRSPRWVISSGKPVYDDDGRLVRLTGVVVDVTGQVEVAAALAESRFQFQTLTETLPQIVWSCDAEGRHDYFSARWSEFTGIAPDAITEETWQHLVHPEDWSRVSQLWADAMKAGKPYDIDYRFRHHTGEFRWLRVMALPMRDESGDVTRWFGTSTDVHEAYQLAHEREMMAMELIRLATLDQLTDVLTRRAFVDRANEAIELAAQIGKPVSLLMLDIDYFKSVNDTYGHPGGDQVLATAAKRMKHSLKKGDLIGRFGGEEFAVLLPGCSARRAKSVAERVRQSVEDQPISLENGASIQVTVSVGVTTAPLPKANLEAMFDLADKALYVAKAAGRNRSIYMDAYQQSLN